MINTITDLRAVSNRPPIGTAAMVRDHYCFAVADPVARALEQSFSWGLSLIENYDAHIGWLEEQDPALHAQSTGADQQTALASARLAHLHSVGDDIVARFADAGFAIVPESRHDGLPDWTLLAPRSARWWLAISRMLSNQLRETGLRLQLSGPWPT